MQTQPFHFGMDTNALALLQVIARNLNRGATCFAGAQSAISCDSVKEALRRAAQERRHFLAVLQPITGREVAADGSETDASQNPSAKQPPKSGPTIDEAILALCLRREETTLNAYKVALQQETFPPRLREELARQVWFVERFYHTLKGWQYDN